MPRARCPARTTFKVLGLVVIGDRSCRPVLDRCLALIPAALIAALIVKDTFSRRPAPADRRPCRRGRRRGDLAAWRKAPLIVVIIVGAGVTAAVRAIA